jgi:hypothetical protein
MSSRIFGMATDRAHALVDELCGPPDAAAARSVDVLHAQAAALAWVRQFTGSYPAPTRVVARVDAAAGKLRAGEDDRDPRVVLIQVAVDALGEDSPSAA